MSDVYVKTCSLKVFRYLKCFTKSTEESLGLFLVHGAIRMITQDMFLTHLYACNMHLCLWLCFSLYKCVKIEETSLFCVFIHTVVYLRYLLKTGLGKNLNRIVMLKSTL